MLSGADRRSRRQRSGRSVHRRDAKRNISVPMMPEDVPAAKQRDTMPFSSRWRRSRSREGLTELSVGRSTRSCAATRQAIPDPLLLGRVPARERSGGQVTKRRTGGSHRIRAAGGCGMGAAWPLRSTLWKQEKMGSRPKACGFSTVSMEGGRPCLYIIWVVFWSGACGAENTTKFRLC